MPLVAFCAYGLIGAIGGLAIIRAAKIAENSTDYSLQNTVRQSLFLPTDRAVKYKAKAAIDTFFVRAGDLLAALVVGFGIHQLGFGGRELALVNVGLVFVWFAIAVGIARRHQVLSPEEPHAEERRPARKSVTAGAAA
jgi:ATP:ADP antiporter, AAA family